MNYQITALVQSVLNNYLAPGAKCIDATMGNGFDSLFLANNIGENGHLYSFDIQKQALENTTKLLNEKCSYHNYSLILDSHANLDNYVKEEVDVIMFNLGYLPTGDHNIATKAQSTIAAMEKGLALLKKQGVMMVTIYSGKDSGFEERDSVLAYLKKLNSKKYLVLKLDYFNRENNPPMPVMIVKL